MVPLVIPATKVTLVDQVKLDKRDPKVTQVLLVHLVIKAYKVIPVHRVTMALPVPEGLKVHTVKRVMKASVDNVANLGTLAYRDCLVHLVLKVNLAMPAVLVLVERKVLAVHLDHKAPMALLVCPDPQVNPVKLAQRENPVNGVILALPVNPVSEVQKVNLAHVVKTALLVPKDLLVHKVLLVKTVLRVTLVFTVTLVIQVLLVNPVDQVGTEQKVSLVMTVVWVQVVHPAQLVMSALLVSKVAAALPVHLVQSDVKDKKVAKVSLATLVHLVWLDHLVQKDPLEKQVLMACVVYLVLSVSLVFLDNPVQWVRMDLSAQKVLRVPRENLDQRETRVITVSSVLLENGVKQARKVNVVLLVIQALKA